MRTILSRLDAPELLTHWFWIEQKQNTHSHNADWLSECLRLVFEKTRRQRTAACRWRGKWIKIDVKMWINEFYALHLPKRCVNNNGRGGHPIVRPGRPLQDVCLPSSSPIDLSICWISARSILRNQSVSFTPPYPGIGTHLHQCHPT